MQSVLIYIHDVAFEEETVDTLLKDIRRYRIEPHSVFLACQPRIAIYYQNALREWLYDANHYVHHRVPLSQLTLYFRRILFVEKGVSTLWTHPPVPAATIQNESASSVAS